MAERDAWEQPLYRFAHLLLRDGDAARTAVLETLEAGIKKRPAHIEPERLVMLQFRDIRRRALKASPTASATFPARAELPADAVSVVQDADAPRIEEILRALPEPGRSAYALLLFDALESEWIAKMLGLAHAEFAETVQGARLAVHRALAPKPETAS